MELADGLARTLTYYHGLQQADIEYAPMPFPVNDDPRYFSLTGFAAIVSRAARLGYRIACFRAFAPPAEAPVLLLRHDLDGPLAGARAFAELEAEPRRAGDVLRPDSR